MSVEVKPVKPAHYGWQYGYYNDREAFPVSGPGIDHECRHLFHFASPELADQMCKVLQSVYAAGVEAGKEHIRAAMGIKAP